MPWMGVSFWRRVMEGEQIRRQEPTEMPRAWSLFFVFLVAICVGFGRLGGVMSRVLVMAVRDMSVVGALLGVPGLVMLGGFSMMVRGLLVMLRCFFMALDSGFRHDDLLPER